MCFICQHTIEEHAPLAFSLNKLNPKLQIDKVDITLRNLPQDSKSLIIVGTIYF